MVEDTTTSNTVTNSGITQTLEELNLGAEKNVTYRYSVSGLFPRTDTWKGLPHILQRSGKSYKEYMSEHTEESIHTNCKLFCSLHCDYYDEKFAGSWSNAADQEVFEMCKSLVMRSTVFSKSLEADK